MKQQIVFTHKFEQSLSDSIAKCNPDKIFVLADDTTIRMCYNRIKHFESLKKAQPITIPSADVNKNLTSLSCVWTVLQAAKATRYSMLINLGGGMVTDIGGFAAATFKRGINFVNVPTTLLAMVDASVGGKTGINFGGLKNEIGAFAFPQTVIIDTQWLETLDHENLLSGYAEMLKHGLITERKLLPTLLNFDTATFNLHQLSDMLKVSVAIKEQIVEQDPHEQGIRKALNFGHTFGHAFEEWAMTRHPILHGYAVAYGMVCELYLSAIKQGFPQTIMRQTVNFIRNNYGTLPITCDDYDALISLMIHDKKNAGNNINFSLLHDLGSVVINRTATEEEIKDALDFLREGV
ncbi:3-dehydroquinate synthase [Prevotella pallens]|jgi:3-dehydroquinate synthase|uniref:3-dehydroquinate synthase n=1 Tax=Prevotella pallens TaxID=60133 RepID=UPI001CABE4C7|nr:3-dehydroquinate synthase [Prevotella pallens]MBF1478146.1 3-dehydroquinate synthase [Prevotella pallens]